MHLYPVSSKGEVYMEKKSFNKYLFALTLPIIIQNLITTALNLLDTVMIGQVGEVELAAVGIANQFYFLYSLFIFGIAGGAGVLIAQLWGNKDKENIRNVLGRAIITASFLSALFIVVGAFKTESIICLFNPDPKIVAVASGYLRITLFGYLFTSISFVLAAALRSINNTRMPMYASIVGLLVNGILNYTFIFGHFGVNAMYANGAAYATIIARTIECLILIIFVRKHVDELKLSIEHFKKMPEKLHASLKKVTYPILFNEACWGIGTVTYMGIYAHLGTQATAAMQICTTIMNLFMVVAFGLSYGALVVVGNEVGAGNGDKAMILSGHIRKLALRVSLALSIVLLVSSGFIAEFFNVSEAVKHIAANILLVFAIMLPLKMMNMLMVVGVLRGGGDALYGTILQGSTLWAIGIPLTFIAGFVFHWPVHFVVAVSAVEEILKCILIERRYRSEKWVKVVFN